MKFSIDRAALLAAVDVAKRAVSPRSTLPALNGILASAREGGELILKATDFEIGIETTVPASVQDPGEAVLPAERIRALLSALTAERVDLSGEKGRVSVSSGSGRHVLNGYPPEEYPSVPAPPETAELAVVPGESLAAVVREVAFATQAERFGSLMSGVMLRSIGGILAAAATDTHRLAVSEFPISGGSEDEEKGQIVVPERALREAAHLAGSAPTTLRWTCNSAEFSGDGWRLHTRLIAGVYPHYERVIPWEGDLPRALLDREEVLRALRALRAVADLHLFESRVICSFSEGELRFSLSSDHGDGSVGVAAESMGKVPGKFGMNLQYLEQAVKAMDAPTIKVAFGGADTCQSSGVGLTVLLRPVGIDWPEGRSHLSMLLPMILDEAEQAEGEPKDDDGPDEE